VALGRVALGGDRQGGEDRRSPGFPHQWLLVKASFRRFPL
jgi:hypothetical protein